MSRMDDFQLGIDELFMAEAEQLGQFVHQVVFVLVKGAVRIGDPPDGLNDLELFFHRIILIDAICKLP